MKGIINESVEMVDINAVSPWPRNPRNGDLEAIAESIRQNGFYGTLTVQKSTGHILAGNHRWMAALEVGLKEVPVAWVDVDDEMAARINLVDNRSANLGWDDDALIAEILSELPSLEGTGYDDEALAEIIAKQDLPLDLDGIGDKSKTLAERFGVPPFSVLDARQGYWQTRKRAWIEIGIQSELGRGEGLLGFSEQACSHYKGQNYTKTKRGEGWAIDQLLVNSRKGAEDFGTGGPGTMDETRKAWRKDADKRSNLTQASEEPAWATGTGTENMASGTSIFDPVLCELAYRWFCPPAGLVLDPFAGGSVRGIVAARLGREYIGIDLRPEQVEANEHQARELVPDAGPCWHVGDSRDVAKIVGEAKADFVFTCPPYYDLEVYSDEPGDLSRAGDYGEFLNAYRDIIQKSISTLKPDRFACVVVGDIRDKKGFYRNFVSDTIAAFEDSGARLYNEAILVTSVGSLPMRVGRQFEASRKLGKTHQQVLVFCKGDPKKATEAVGPVEFGEAMDESDDPAAQYGEVLG